MIKTIIIILLVLFCFSIVVSAEIGQVNQIYKVGTIKATGKIGNIKLPNSQLFDFTYYDLEAKLYSKVKKGYHGYNINMLLHKVVTFEMKNNRDLKDKSLYIYNN